MSNKLSIVVLFCDKDYSYIPSLLRSIDRKVICEHEVILLDNREQTKEYDVQGIDTFFNNHSGIYIKNGKNLAQLASKKKALNYCTGNYIWFFDGDDELCDTVSPFILDECCADIIAFNYVYFKSCDDETVYNAPFSYKRTVTETSEFQNADYLNYYGVTCWNKWFKKDILVNSFKNIPTNKLISCNEDVWINSIALKNAKSITEYPTFIYMNRPDRGVSNNKITSIERFNLIAQGYKESFKLFKKEFPVDCPLFDESSKTKGDIAYFVNRIYNSDSGIIIDELKIVSSIFKKEDIIDVVNNFTEYGFLSEPICNRLDMEIIIYKIKRYFDDFS